MNIPLSLGLAGLSAPERALVATLFRLHRVEPGFNWTLADGGPVDALLVDESCGDQDFVHLADRHTQAMRLSAHGVEREGQMSRPIRSDRLVGWLKTVEQARLAQPVLRPSVLPSPSPAVPAGGVARQAEPAWRLRRWPSPGLLGKDAMRIRLATMLSRRAMSLPELATLARVPLAHCRHFVNELQRQGLIDALPAGPAVRPDRTASRAAVADASTRRGVGATLIHSIRRRFGFA